MDTMLMLLCLLLYIAQIKTFRHFHTRKSISCSTHTLNPTVLWDNLLSNKQEFETTNNAVQESKPSAFDMVASKGLAGVLAIAVAEAIFWALGMPLGSDIMHLYIVFLIDSYYYNFIYEF